jgi:hypothetical protein
MKTFIVLALAAVSITACGDHKNTETTTVTSDTLNSYADTSTTVVTDNTVAVNPYVAAEGDISYKDGKLMVYRNNAWVVADKDVTLDSGIVVRRNGEVVRNGTTVKLEEC